MVDAAVSRLSELFKDDCSQLQNVNGILECLWETNNGEFAEKVFTNAANCMETEKDKFESIHNLVSLAVNLFNVPYSGTVGCVVKFICNILLSVRGRRDSFSIVSDNLSLELSEKMKDVEEKLHAFCAFFDARSGDLNTLNKEGEKTEERVERLLDDVNYKEIGMVFSGELEAIILRYKNVREEEILRAVGECLNVYVRVAIMRCMMQIMILSIIPDERMESATGRIKKYMKEDILRRVAFLTRTLEPNHENAIFLSSFSITEFPELDMFLKTKWSTKKEKSCVWDISAFLTNKSIALHPVVFRGHWMNAATVKLVWSTSKAPHDDYAQFRFAAVSERENIFFITPFRRSSSYIYMKPNSLLSQTSTRPREEGMFKIIRLQNDNCLISVVKYPCRFIYMPNTRVGRIKGAVTDYTYQNGLPTEQHEWSLKEVCHRRYGDEIHKVENPKIVSAFSSKNSGKI